MKFVRLLALAFSITIGPASAQVGFYLKAGGGWGGTWSRDAAYSHTSISDPANAYHGAVSAGVQNGQWAFELGMGFSRTGGSTTGIYFEQDFDPQGNPISTAVDARYTLLHRHHIQTLSVGRSLPLARRWTLQPRLGVEGAYNTTRATRRIRSGNRLRAGGVNAEVYRMTYNRMALFGTAAVQAHWRASPRVGVFGGLGYRRALTNLVRVPAGFSDRYSVRTMSATVDAGVLFFLSARAAGSERVGDARAVNL